MPQLYCSQILVFLFISNIKYYIRLPKSHRIRSSKCFSSLYFQHQLIIKVYHPNTIYLIAKVLVSFEVTPTFLRCNMIVFSKHKKIIIVTNNYMDISNPEGTSFIS